jgi:hypothetical protein
VIFGSAIAIAMIALVLYKTLGSRKGDEPLFDRGKLGDQGLYSADRD